MKNCRNILMLLVLSSPYSVLAADNGTTKQYTANVKITEVREGKPVTLAAPKLLFVVGQKAEIHIGDDTRKIEVTVESVKDKQPPMHLVQAKIIDAPLSKTPTTLASPKLWLLGKTGTINCDKIKIEATIEEAVDQQD